MKDIQKLAGQTVIYGMGTVVPRFLHYAVLTPFYTRIFIDTRDYGVVTELYAWMVLLLVILTYGMETGFFRFTQKSDNTDEVFSTALISLFCTSVLFILAVNVFIEPVSKLMNYSSNQDYIRMFSAIIAIDAFTAIPFARLRKDKRPMVFSAIKLFNVFITLGLVFFLLKIAPQIYEKSNGWFRDVYKPDYKVGYIFVANLVSSSLTLVILLPYTLPDKLKFKFSLWKSMILYSFPLLLAGLSGSINDAIDKVLLRRIIGADEGLAIVGKYGAAYKIGVLMALFIQMFRFAAEPYFFERAKKENSAEAYAYIMKYFIIVMLIIFLVINLYISGFQYIVGKNYRDALNIVPIISMGYLLYGIYLNHSIWYKLSDLTWFGAYITLIGAIITILMNLFLIPVFGYMASAWAHIFSYGTMILLSFVLAKKHYRIEYNMSKLTPYFVIAISMVIFSQLFDYYNLRVELLVNTLMVIGFLAFANWKDNLLTVFLKKN